LPRLRSIPALRRVLRQVVAMAAPPHPARGEGEAVTAPPSAAQQARLMAEERMVVAKLREKLGDGDGTDAVATLLTTLADRCEALTKANEAAVAIASKYAAVADKDVEDSMGNYDDVFRDGSDMGAKWVAQEVLAALASPAAGAGSSDE